MNCFGYVTAPLHIHAKNTCVNNKWPLASAPADSIRRSIIAPPLCVWMTHSLYLWLFWKDINKFIALCTLVRESLPACVGAKWLFSHYCLPNETLAPLPPGPRPHTLRKHIDCHAPRAQIDLALWQRPGEIRGDGRRHHGGRLAAPPF